MTNPIVITGCGVVSAIGVNKAETLDALLNNRSGVGPLKYLKTEHKEFPVGEVKLTDAEKVRKGFAFGSCEWVQVTFMSFIWV